MPIASTPLLLAAALFAFPSVSRADALPGPSAPDTLDFSENGEALVNGSAYQDGTQRMANVFAEVVKVVQGPEGTTVLYLRPLEARRSAADGSVETVPMAAEPRPFVAEADWRMFDAEGAVTNDPRFALRVILPYALTTSDAMLVDTAWNECQGPISGNYSGLPCNKNRGLSDDYMAFLRKNFLPCVNQGMRATGLPSAASVHIQHDGTVADERHNKSSLHAVGRAIDVMQVTAVGADGRPKGFFDFQKTNVDHKLSRGCKPAGTANCRFFEAFRACWHKLHVARRCPARQSGPIGTIGWEDPDHIAHHLHTSYPFCPNNKGYFITQNAKKAR